MTDKFFAPFTPEQVESINGFQEWGGMHGFTCPNHSSALLVATHQGLHCPSCTYEQFWVHDFMANGDWRDAAAHYDELFSHRKDGAG